jgi:recombinational DNA repair ATPase RecF
MSVAISLYFVFFEVEFRIDRSHEQVGDQSNSQRRGHQVLAIRLVLIEHFSSQGVELPVVLDDILVNFDHERTQAALSELIRRTSEDQQILFFTCHQHLAEMFRQRGVSTVTLPDRRALSEGKLAG